MTPPKPHPTGRATKQFADTLGRRIATTSPQGQRTRYEYDLLNRPTKITDPLGGLTQFTYDPNGNRLTLTDPRSSVTSWAYDNMDRLQSRTDPLLRAETYAYDTHGNLTSFTDRKSQVTSRTYDALDRLTQVTYADTSTTSYTWDTGNRITQITDSISGTITRAYDLLDRLTQETTPQGSVSYTYDAAGRRTSMTVAGQPMVTYGYDNANRLTSLTQGSAVVGFTYDNAGQRTALTRSNGISTEYAYDAAGRVTGLTYKNGVATLGTLTYAYDANASRRQLAGTWARTGLPAAVSSVTYDVANRQLTIGAQTLTYDFNGNLTGDGTTTYTWDARNRLVSLSGPGLTASFQYDATGRRIGKTFNGTATGVLHDGPDAVQASTGGTVRNILTGLGIDEYLSHASTSGESRFMLADALGSTIALVDASGTVVTEYTYEPFGATTITGVPSENSAQYTGRENDGTGLYYYRARYYHPGLQRFISEDPIRFKAGDANFYVYVANSPSNYRDASGLVLEQVLVPTPAGHDVLYFDTGVVQDLKRALQNARAAGIPIQITSAFRTTAHQERLGAGGADVAFSAAPPRTSFHEAGLGFDINTKNLTAEQLTAWNEIAAKNGFYRDVRGDKVHYQVRHLAEYGYGDLSEAIAHNQDYFSSLRGGYEAQRAGERAPVGGGPPGGGGAPGGDGGLGGRK